MNAIKSFFYRIDSKVRFCALVFSMWRNPWTRPLVKATVRTYRTAQKFARHVRKIGPSTYAATATGDDLTHVSMMFGIVRGIGESDDSLRARTAAEIASLNNRPPAYGNKEATE